MTVTANSTTVVASVVPSTTNISSSEFTFGCSRLGCSYAYQLDAGPAAPWVALGSSGSSGSDAGSTAPSSNASVIVVDTMLALVTRRVTNRTSATVHVGVLLNGVSTAILMDGSASVQVRVDGAATWTDVRSMTYSNASGVSFGGGAELVTVEGRLPSFPAR